MLARDFWKAVTVDRADLLDRFLLVLRTRQVRFCVVGGQAVNAYVDPVVSLDLDVVVAVADLSELERVLRAEFIVERVAHGINVSSPGSDLRVQIETDSRYDPFVAHAVDRDVLGITLPVASIEDVWQGKIWAVEEPTRRASKRQKDLAGIARLLEQRLDLRAQVPARILERLI